MADLTGRVALITGAADGIRRAIASAFAGAGASLALLDRAEAADVDALTFFLARELAPDGIRVNAIAPGPIASAMTTNLPQNLRALIPAGRMGRAEDVANAALFQAGEAASFVTAEILDVNGGMWAD